jgi:predicted DNA-binding antitoxin AbrB/MazE fold protein
MRFKATYENGFLKPRLPLPIGEHAEVEVEIEVTGNGMPKTLPHKLFDEALGSVSLGGNACDDSESLYDDP